MSGCAASGISSSGLDSMEPVGMSQADGVPQRFYRPTVPFRRTITTIVGALLVVSGIMCVIACEPSVREYVVTMYVILSGGLVVMLEQYESSVQSYVPFLVESRGGGGGGSGGGGGRGRGGGNSNGNGGNSTGGERNKGWFYLLVGGLGLGSNWWQFSTALAMMLVAVWHISTPAVSAAQAGPEPRYTASDVMSDV